MLLARTPLSVLGQRVGPSFWTVWASPRAVQRQETQLREGSVRGLPKNPAQQRAMWVSRGQLGTQKLRFSSPLHKSIRTKEVIQAHETTHGSQIQKTQPRPTFGFSLFEFTTFFFPRFEGHSTTFSILSSLVLLQLLPLSLSPPFS